MSMTHEYIPRVDQREENLFVEEYYSGTDVKVTLNGVEQSEISYINYSLNEQLKPIFGYASRTFDDVSVGNRIVTGVFKMPIRNPKKQTNKEEVFQRVVSTEEEIEANNQAEEQKKTELGWPDATDTKAATEDAQGSDIYRYQIKLKQLGYNLVGTGKYDTATRTAILRFQNDNKLSGTGTFTNDTKNTIDVMIQLAEYPSKKAKDAITIYAGPSGASGVVGVLQKGDTFYILETVKSFTQIQLFDGRIGYVNSVEIGG